MQKFFLIFIYSFILRFFLKLVVGVKFDDTSFLENEEQFVILPNHNSHLDTIAILASLPSSIIHKVKPVAAGDYFGKTKLIGWLSEYFVNALLIQRKNLKNSASNSPLESMESTLNDGYSLILFPEGTRGEPEVMQSLKRGIAVVLAKREQTPYIPVYMSGMGKNLPKGEKMIVPFNARVIYGKPTLISSSDSKEIISNIEHDILSLKG